MRCPAAGRRRHGNRWAYVPGMDRALRLWSAVSWWLVPLAIVALGAVDLGQNGSLSSEGSNVTFLQHTEVGEQFAGGTELSLAAGRAVQHGAAFDQMNLGSGPQPARCEYQVVRHGRTSFAFLGHSVWVAALFPAVRTQPAWVGRGRTGRCG